MPAMANREEVEGRGDRLLRLVEAHRKAPAGSDREKELEAKLERAFAAMRQEPETTAAVAMFLANFICAMNESLPARQQMRPGPRPGIERATQHRAPGAR